MLEGFKNEKPLEALSPGAFLTDIGSGLGRARD